jgi:hypothetical protein
MRPDLATKIKAEARAAAAEHVTEAAPNSYAMGFTDGAEWALKMAGYETD